MIAKFISRIFTIAILITASNLAIANSVWQTLDDYNFKNPEQKQAIVYLLTQAGMVNVEQTLKRQANSPEVLAKSLQQFLELTQKYFIIRSESQERWQIEPTAWMKNSQQQAKMLESLKILGLTAVITPKFAQRDALCILGATYNVMIKRMAYAGDLYAKGNLATQQLILLAGERYVDLSIDGSEQELAAIAKPLNKKIADLTETDLIQAAYAKSSLYGKLPTVTIDTPRAELPRPTTATTMLELTNWLMHNPSVKTITFVSSQPYVGYQQAVIARVLKQQSLPDIKFEVIGQDFNIANQDPATAIQTLVEALGTQINALTPSVLAKQNLTS